MSFDPDIYVSVGCVLIRDDGRVLLQLRDDIPTIRYPGYWCLPSGEREPGESNLDGALREMREETGYLMRDPKPLPVSTISHSDGWNVTCCLFWERYDESQALEVLEGSAMEFVHPSELGSLKLVPGVEGLVDLAVMTWLAERARSEV